MCAATQTPVIIKAYEKSKMKPKNLARLEREIHLMRRLGGGDGLVDLHAVFEDSAFKYLVNCHWPMSPGAIDGPVKVSFGNGLSAKAATAFRS